MIKTMRADSLKNIVDVPPAPQAGADLDAVEHFMLRCIGLHSETSNALQDALTNHFQAGGGRTRARLGLKAADALLLAPRTAIALAAAAELLHNASLIHDDLQDRSATRRGAPALWVSCSEETAICAGDLLIDLPDIPKNIIRKLDVRPVSTIDEVLNLALVELPQGEAVRTEADTARGEGDSETGRRAH